MYIDEQTMVVRILMAAALGFLVGLERERHGRAAGLRTCILVSAAGALLMSLSLHLAQIFSPTGAESAFRLDPGRLPSYAIAGMGFLGAGAIIQGRAHAVGITTAAAMWTCTGVGLAVGAGLYWPALAAVALALASLMLLRGIARRVRHEQSVSLEVESEDAAIQQPLRELLERSGAQVGFVGRKRCLDRGRVVLSLSLTIYSGPKWGDVLAELENLPGLVCYTWREAEVP
ncbi:MAG: MgtC/SapB family protein [Desulfarculaceae bacterium]|jgi:putative Mg2+ transporter-C (MgtC) family protein